MKKEYSIVKMNVGNSNPYGRVYIVRANPVITMGITKSAHADVDDTTEIFIFEDNEEIENTLMRIARSRHIWTPTENDFRDAHSLNEKIGKTVMVHWHASIYGQSYDETLNSGETVPIQIHNEIDKASRLSDQYINNGWMYTYTLREYVESLANGEDVDNFFGWLFDDKNLNGYTEYDLPDEYQCAYRNFLNNFGDDDEGNEDCQDLWDEE